MLTSIYLYLIYPLEALMQWCLEGAYFTTHSYGLAIILLSVCVSLLTLPLYAAAEAWQEEERGIKAELTPGLQHIKRAFRGQEQFFMIKTLYRQHGYHPVMALRTSLGLLIQIPFFFAAYQFLSQYEPLDGVSFLWFGNLARPDGLLEVGGQSLNVLPLVMTGINLCSAQVYGQRIGRREKTQLYLLALLFLVLLYNSPAALVLYWTMNNAFSLGKNLIERRTDPLPALSRLAGTIDTMTLPTRGLILVVVAAAASIAAVETGVLPGALQIAATFVSFALMLYLSVAAVGVFIRAFSPTPFKLLRACVIVVLYALTSLSLAAVLSSNQYSFALAQESFSIWLGLTAIVLISLASPSLRTDEPLVRVDKPHVLLLLAGGLVVAVVCIFSPISLYVSDPAQFSITLFDVVSGASIVGLVFLLILSITYLATVEQFRGLYAYVMTCLAVVVCLYTFLLVGDYGSIDFYTLDEQSFSSPMLLAADVLVAMLVGAVVFYVISANYWQHSAQILGILLLTTLLASAYQLYVAETPLDESRIAARESRGGLAPLPEYNEDLLNFSRAGKNIVVVMLDAFNAYTLPVSLEREPSLRDGLDGFTWYRNTLASGYVTALGEPGVHGGHRYTPLEIQKREYVSVSDESARGYQVFGDAFGDNGFDVSFAGVQHTRCDAIVRYGRVPPLVCVEDGYIYDYANSIRWPGKDDTSIIHGVAGANSTIDYARVLAAIGVFRAAPFSMKEWVYGNGAWLNTFPLAKKNLKGARKAARNLSGLHALSEASGTSSARSTFKYIQNNLTHRPFFLDAETCLPALRESHDEAARDCALRLIVAWLESLEDEGIYDNTMIVLVSDHGSRRFGSNLGIPLTRTNSLLMVKDFDRRGSLQVSDAFMSNADVPAIVCAAIGGCPGVVSDPRREASSRTLYFVKGSNKDNNRRISRDNTVYRVKDSIFDPDNWSIVE